MIPKQLELTLDTIFLSESFWPCGGVSFPIPPDWEYKLNLGVKDDIDRCDDGSILVKVFVRGQDCPPKGLEVIWGSGATQHRELLFGKDPSNGRHYLATTVPSNKNELISLTIHVLDHPPKHHKPAPSS